MLTTEQAADWLGLSERDLLKKSRGNRAAIPAFGLGHKTKRFHPRTIITRLAQQAGVSADSIAAGFGIQTNKDNRA